jgi:hypothetical protein
MTRGETLVLYTSKILLESGRVHETMKTSESWLDKDIQRVGAGGTAVKAGVEGSRGLDVAVRG